MDRDKRSNKNKIKIDCNIHGLAQLRKVIRLTYQMKKQRILRRKNNTTGKGKPIIQNTHNLDTGTLRYKGKRKGRLFSKTRSIK